MTKAFLIMQRGKNIGTKFDLKQGQTSIGRNPDNDIVIDEVAVSRYHAVFRFDEKNGEATVMDLGSTNGVVVNSIEIKSGTPYKLQQRDTVFVGRAIFNIQFRPDSYAPTATTRPNDTDRTGHLVLPVQYQQQTQRLS
jgi:pSer/pThr/pTyr-binding forkhead associated (FHA) protein